MHDKTRGEATTQLQACPPNPRLHVCVSGHVVSFRPLVGEGAVFFFSLSCFVGLDGANPRNVIVVVAEAVLKKRRCVARGVKLGL